MSEKIIGKAAELLDLQANAAPPRRYWDKANYASLDDQLAALASSTTVYVGNLSYYTSEQHVFEFARQAGPIKKVIMGLHREKKTPCGFAFVEYFDQKAFYDAEALLNGKTLEGRVVKMELDPGFKEGRQFGRGRGGGQVRDDFREEDDPERGGVGSLAQVGLLPSQNTVASASQLSSGSAPHSSRWAPEPAGAMQAYARNPEDPGMRGGEFKKGRFDSDRDHDYQSRGNFEARGPPRHRSRDRGNPYQRGGASGRRPNYQQHQQGGNRPPPRDTQPMVDEFGRDIDPQRRQ